MGLQRDSHETPQESMEATMDNGNVSNIGMKSAANDLSVSFSSESSGSTERGDVSSLILVIMLRQSDAIYDEMKNLTTVMQNRNKKLEMLGEVLSKVQSAMPSKQDGSGNIAAIMITDPETKVIIPLNVYLKNNNLLPDTSINPGKVTYTQFQGIVSTIQSKQDSLNNDSQTDSLRVQSMTNAYNKYLDQTSSVLSKASDTKDRILANMKS